MTRATLNKIAKKTNGKVAVAMYKLDREVDDFFLKEKKVDRKAWRYLKKVFYLKLMCDLPTIIQKMSNVEIGTLKQNEKSWKKIQKETKKRAKTGY